MIILSLYYFIRRLPRNNNHFYSPTARFVFGAFFFRQIVSFNFTRWCLKNANRWRMRMIRVFSSSIFSDPTRQTKTSKKLICARIYSLYIIESSLDVEPEEPSRPNVTTIPTTEGAVKRNELVFYANTRYSNAV